MSNSWQHYNIFCCYAFKSIIWIFERINNLYEVVKLVSERVQILEPGLSDSLPSVLSITLRWARAKYHMETCVKISNLDSHIIVEKESSDGSASSLGLNTCDREQISY